MRPRGLAQNSALALAGDLAAKGGMLAAMMVAARGLPTVQFALLATALAVATVLTATMDLGSQTLLTRDGVDSPAARGSLLYALALARAPMLVAALAIAAAFGVATGHPLEAVATVLIAVAGTVQLSLTGALRSAQDLAPEAVAKLLAGVLMLVAAALCVTFVPHAGTMLLALTLASSLSLAPLVRSVRLVARRGSPPRSFPTLRRAAPLGAMALATLAYYRSGTIALSLLGAARETALFAAASTLAWGLLCVANAVTTGLLPRLAAASSPADLAAVTRRALVWTGGLAMILAALVAALARPLLVLVFGARYGDATGPLVLLVAATVLIAPAGVLGTALVAVGRLRPLCIQVGCSLLVNLVALLLLVPVAGAVGAAGATLACETLALVLLTRAALQALPGIRTWPPRRVSALPATFAAKPGR